MTLSFNGTEIYVAHIYILTSTCSTFTLHYFPVPHRFWSPLQFLRINPSSIACIVSPFIPYRIELNIYSYMCCALAGPSRKELPDSLAEAIIRNSRSLMRLPFIVLYKYWTYMLLSLLDLTLVHAHLQIVCSPRIDMSSTMDVPHISHASEECPRPSAGKRFKGMYRDWCGTHRHSLTVPKPLLGSLAY